ncbi:murein L,D-transpeptidase catalytic domain family protein [Parasphingopyxis algicola]|uniref:murein L,D-transpeptidase catalytic domain family protein n=1 Tax=Parasphingopyxis algicola TaxID=2026624 RepID=UPI001FE904A4|nr:murein L,D-transpeptidase catalytic domain family protein [Parasphingopyxis algicola]
MVAGGALAASIPAAATAPVTPAAPNGDLLQRALAALQRHQDAIVHRDLIGVADFNAPSRLPRFSIIDLASGRAERLLVTHGRGSDPSHSGWLQRFSNVPGSAATSSGAYLTGRAYSGSHGPSRRLAGLDPENSNAEARAIVIHSAWYANPEVVQEQGKLGRSEGCFAFSHADIAQVLDRLGPGRLIYADKV